MARKVIYTVLTGGYDRLEQPAVVDPSYDYICFTEKDGKDGVWQLRKIPFETPDNITRARYSKLQPHVVLPEYEYSVFMDANLCIIGPEFYEKVEAAIARGDSFAVVEHPQRDCVWEELRYCFLKEKLTADQAFRHHRYLKSIGMPRHAGLYETNILLRAHNQPEIQALDNAWWQAYCNCCTRDQLTLTPSLFLAQYRPALLLAPGLCSRNVPYVRYTLHPRTGKENVPGKLNWANLSYRLRLLLRKFLLLWLR